jgi:integrase/recombinase XerC/integrase/recombinase XerD
MGTVHRLTAATAAVPATLGGAVDTYLTYGLGGSDHDATRRTYGGILRRLVAQFGEAALLDELDPDAVAGWFIAEWDQRARSTWNVSLDAIRLAAAYWQKQGWTDSDPTVRLARKRLTEDRDRALSRADVERLLTRDGISIRERTLWRMLYETAARSAEVLRLDVDGLDLPNRRATVRRKGGAIDVVTWQTGTARLLPRLLKGRRSGPVFVTMRRPRAGVEFASADLDEEGRARLSYKQAEAMFKAASGGKTLHQLRHSALTHAAEDGMSTPMMMTKSGHKSVRSLARYARPSIEALQRHEAEHDPARIR